LYTQFKPTRLQIPPYTARLRRVPVTAVPHRYRALASAPLYAQHSYPFVRLLYDGLPLRTSLVNRLSVTLLVIADRRGFNTALVFWRRHLLRCAWQRGLYSIQDEKPSLPAPLNGRLPLLFLPVSVMDVARGGFAA